jgi:uncharacterized protein
MARGGESMIGSIVVRRRLARDAAYGAGSLPGPESRRGGRLGAVAVSVAVVVGLGVWAVPAHAQVYPTARQVENYTGLHAAAWAGDVAQIEKLVAAKADLNARDEHGRTPLHVATFARQREAIRALFKAGADHALLENGKYDTVTIAAVADDEKTLRLLLSLGASAKLTTSRWDGTALIAAADLGHEGCVQILIDAGAPLDHINTAHYTAIIEATILGKGDPRHVETLRRLVAAGADTQIPNREGRTPLELAKARGYTEMVQILEQAAAKAAPKK